MIACQRHPQTAATFECPDCLQFSCGACAKVLVVRNQRIEQCAGCGGMLRSIVVHPDRGRQARDQRQQQVRASSVAGWLTDAARFVTRRSVLVAMVGLAIVAGICLWVSVRSILFYGTFMAALGRALEASTYFHIVERSAFGDEDLEPPEFHQIWDSVILPLLRYAAASLPVLIGLIWYAVASDTFLQAPLVLAADPWRIFDHGGPAVLVCGGLVLLPVMTMAAAITRSVLRTLHPLVWFDTARAMGRDWVLVTAAFLGLVVVESAVWMPVAAKLTASLPSTVLATIALSFLGYVPMVMRARLLGASIEPYI